jgi:hypothetical protein
MGKTLLGLNILQVFFLLLMGIAISGLCVFYSTLQVCLFKWQARRQSKP